MQSLIETVVKMLVDKPDEVNVEAVESDQTIIYELTVGDGDYGKVIGKKRQKCFCTPNNPFCYQC